MFSRFCKTVGTFRELFQANPSPENDEAGQAQDSLVVPDIVKDGLLAHVWQDSGSSASEIYIIIWEAFGRADLI